MSMEQRDGNCHKMSQIVVNCRDVFFPSPFRRSLLDFADNNNKTAGNNFDSNGNPESNLCRSVTTLQRGH